MATNIKNRLTSQQTKELQNALTSLGYSVGSTGADGILGANTQKAIDAAYKDLGLKTWTGGGLSQSGYDKILAAASGTKAKTNTTQSNLVWTPNTGSANDTAAIAKAEAYLTGGTYNPGTYSYDTSNWAGSQGLKAAMYGNNKDYKSLGMTAKDMERINTYAALYDQGILDQQQAKFDELQNMYSQIADIQQMYQQALDAQQRMHAEQQAAKRAEIEDTVGLIKGNEGTIHDNFNAAQKEAYISSMLEKRDMTDYLAAMGYTGGMTESTAAQIRANYQNNRQNATFERDAALRNNERLIAEARISGNSDLAQLAASATSDYINALKDQAGMTFQVNQAQLAQQNADREYELSKLNSDRDYQLSLDALKRDDQRYVDSQKLSAAETDMQSFLNTYQGKYQKKATYEKWIENLKKLNDPYGFNAQKIAYLKQYINLAFNGGSNSAQTASGSGSGTTNKSGSNSSSVAATEKQTNTYKALRTDILSASLLYAEKDLKREFDKKLSEIELQYKLGGITEKQAKLLLADIQDGVKKREEITVEKPLIYKYK